MKIRSKALYDYLLYTGVLHGSEADIAGAKYEYRKQYKRNWKHAPRPIKEIRFTVTLKQLASIKEKSHAAGLRHTTFAKLILLNTVSEPQVQNALLLEVLQSVSIVINSIESGRIGPPSFHLLLKAETLLLTYLNVP